MILQRTISTYSKIALVLLLFPCCVYGFTISEVQIEPQESVEIVNESSESASLTGWYLDDSGGTSYYTLPDTLLLPHTCIVITTPLNLNKASNDTVRLFMPSVKPTDGTPSAILSYTKSPGPNITWQRNGDTIAAFASSLGLWNDTHLPCVAEPTPTIMAIPTVENNALPLVTSISIIEVLSNPIDDNEWVKLHNNSSSSLSLNNWFIDDKAEEGSSPYEFSALLGPYGDIVVSLERSMINNTGDSVRLLDSQQRLIDSVEVPSLAKGSVFFRFQKTPIPTTLPVISSQVSSPTQLPMLAMIHYQTPVIEEKPASSPAVLGATVEPPRGTGIVFAGMIFAMCALLCYTDLIYHESDQILFSTLFSSSRT